MGPLDVLAHAIWQHAEGKAVEEVTRRLELLL